MSQFTVRLGTPDGRVLREVFQAADERTLRGDLARRGLYVFEVERRGLPVAAGLAALRRRRKMPLVEFLVFNQELAALLRAGMPLLQCLDLMLERMRDPHWRSVLTDIRDRVKSGEDLSDAFAAYGDAFPALYPSTLKAGERTGELEAVVRRFVRYLRLVLEARKRVIGALVYPVVLVGLSIAMLAIMTVYVVPKFMGFFADLEVDLPLITRVVLGTSHFARTHWLWIVAALALGLFLLRRWAATPRGREAVDRSKLRVPFLGPVFQRFAVAEFARSLSTLLAGGIPLVQALEIAVSAVGNAHVRRRLEPTIQQVREGGAFYEALDKTELFDNLGIDMVKVGESTGSLDQMLQNVSELLDDQVETRMARLLSLIEPLMLVVMGLIIGILLVSIYLPLFTSLGKANI